ncbi:hypothetical protein V8F06_001889 [Rhypophila decipiens]
MGRASRHWSTIITFLQLWWCEACRSRTRHQARRGQGLGTENWHIKITLSCTTVWSLAAQWYDTWRFLVSFTLRPRPGSSWDMTCIAREYHR